MAPPRSIGVVLHDLPLGGTERIALRLARAWSEAGVAVTLFVGDPRGPLAAMLPPGARVLPADPPLPRGWRSRVRLARAAAAHFARDPVEALFVIGNWHWEIVPAIAALPAAVRPAIVAQQSSPVAMAARGPIGQWRFERRMRRLLAGVDAVAAMDAHSAGLADRILGRAVSRVIPLPAIDDEAPPPVPAPDAPLLLAAGRLIRQKGFDLLIDAVAAVRGARLTIVGHGPERKRLAWRIARYGIGDRVTLAGYAPDIRPWLDRSRAFVLPSRFEGYGAVIVEALAAGRPVIATRTTPAADDLLADPERGIVVPPHDTGALADAIRTLLAAPAPDRHALAAATLPYRLSAGAAAYLDLFASVRR